MKDISIPVFKRARSYRLYTNDNRKFLDFYQEGGKAVLGSRPAGFSLSLKNEIEKSFYYNLPSIYLKRTEKAFKKLTGAENLNISYYKTLSEMENSISLFEKTEFKIDYNLNIDEKSEPGFIKAWYLYSKLTLEEAVKKYKYIYPVIPFPGDLSPFALLSAKKNPESSYIPSQVAMAGFHKLVNYIIKNRGTNLYSFWGKILPASDNIWKYEIPYLIPVYKKEDHQMIFKSFLEKNILIQPEFGKISVLPAEISEGECKLFLETTYNINRRIPQ